MTDQFELPSGLLEYHPAPWRYQDNSDAYTHIVRNARGGFVIQCGQSTKGNDEALARAIASIPAMVEEIGRLREERDRPLHSWQAENDRLRALNAEMREKATALCDELQEQGHGGSPPHNWECPICFTLDNLRAIPARVEEIGRLKEERDARVSVELLNVERETCDRIRSDNDRLRALNAELLHFIKEVAEMDDMAVERARIIARAILAKSHPSTSAQEAAS